MNKELRQGEWGIILNLLGLLLGFSSFQRSLKNLMFLTFFQGIFRMTGKVRSSFWYLFASCHHSSTILPQPLLEVQLHLSYSRTKSILVILLQLLPQVMQEVRKCSRRHYNHNDVDWRSCSIKRPSCICCSFCGPDLFRMVCLTSAG